MQQTPITRRKFCTLSASAALGSQALLHAGAFAAQPAVSSSGTAARPDVAAIDRERILSAAQRYLSLIPTPITSLVCPRSPASASVYYSEPEGTADSSASSSAQSPFLAHRDALFTLGQVIPALAAAYTLTTEVRYAEAAEAHLLAWFVAPATRMAPALDYTQTVPVTRPAGSPQTQLSGRYQGLLEALPLVEIAIAIPFLKTLNAEHRATIYAWFADYYHWLSDPRDSGPRIAALARDSRDHHGASWMLQASACAWLAAPAGDVGHNEDSALASLRHRYKSITLRAQLSPGGFFPREIATPVPYRNSLFSLDLLAGVCQLLSNRFESVWDYELEDGPGMRAAIAWHFPYIADRGHWPYQADIDHFNDLPGRRSSLLLAARAYQHPEYASLWQTLAPDPPSAAVLRTMPIRQPLLWTRQPSFI